MKFKERNIVIILSIITFIIFVYFVWQNNKPVSFKIAESFADSSMSGKVSFNFVEVDKYDEREMLEFARKLALSNNSLEMLEKNLPVLTVVHFYNPDDILPLNDLWIKKLKRKYHDLKNLEKKLQRVETGYIFTSTSQKIEGINLPSDTLFQSTVIIPKTGLRAKDIMKSTH